MGRNMIWANLIHLSYNMWYDRIPREIPDRGVWSRHAKNYHVNHYPAKPFLRCDDRLWDRLVAEMAAAGLTTVVIDVGDGVRYESRPELGVKGAWSVDKLKRKLREMRAAGLEPVPKLNFSACHDEWLGPYARAVSTKEYYAAVRDVIAETIRIFKPRLFHIGMDEETFNHQRHYRYVVVRQYDLWWHDLYFYIDEIEKKNVRAWMWSDYVWHHPDVFKKKMPRSVLQSNWYYNAMFTREDFARWGRKVKNPEAARINEGYVRAYDLLEKAGYDQVPTGSNWASDENFGNTVAYCSKAISPRRLKGFMTASWAVTLPQFTRYHLTAIEQVRAAKEAYEKKAR